MTNIIAVNRNRDICTTASLAMASVFTDTVFGRFYPSNRCRSAPRFLLTNFFYLKEIYFNEEMKTDVYCLTKVDALEAFSEGLLDGFKMP